MLHQATENCLAKQGIISNGFRRAGLYPWDPSAPDVSKLLPGTIFAGPDSSEGSNFMVTNPEISATIQSSTGEDISTTPDEHSTFMDTIPEMSTTAQVPHGEHFSTPSAGDSSFMVTIPVMSKTIQIPNGEDISTPLSGDSNIMVTIPEMSTSVQVPYDEDIFTPSPGDSNIMAIIPEISSSAHPHDTSDQFSFSYEEGDIGFLDDGSSQLELSDEFVENDSSAMLETPDDSDLNGSSTLSPVTPPRSKKCPNQSLTSICLFATSRLQYLLQLLPHSFPPFQN